MRCARLLAVALALATVAAHADESADLQGARQHTQRGMALFDLQRYDDAIKEYEAAYELRNDPMLLFDIAQAYRKANRPAQAIHYYRTYLARDPNAENRQRVEERIHELEEQLKREPREPPPALATVTTPPPATLTTAPTAAHQTSRPMRPRLVGGIVTGVAGVGLVVGGVVLAVLSGQAADKLTAANNNHTPYDPALYSTNQNDAIGGGIMLGIGAAALATGAALITLDVKRQRAQRGSFARN
jgi:tetratricopeptide (TPR) repeat protein